MDVDGSELGSLAFRPRLVCMGIGFSFLLRFGIAGGRNGIGGGATAGVAEWRRGIGGGVLLPAGGGSGSRDVRVGSPTL